MVVITFSVSHQAHKRLGLRYAPCRDDKGCLIHSRHTSHCAALDQKVLSWKNSCMSEACRERNAVGLDDMFCVFLRGIRTKSR